MKNYQDLIRTIDETGNNHPVDRTGTGTRNVNGVLMRWWLPDGFPAVTVKYTALGLVASEDLWLLSGDTNLKYLLDNNNHIWDDWVLPGTEVWGDEYTLEERWAVFMGKWQREQFTATQLQVMQLEKTSTLPTALDQRNSLMNVVKIPTHRLIDGKLGKIYGEQQRSWEDTRLVTRAQWDDNQMHKKGYTWLSKDVKVRDGQGLDTLSEYMVVTRRIDQVANAIELLKRDPDSRRNIVLAWNPAQLEEMALTPCHMDYQLTTSLLSLPERMGLFNTKLAKAHLKASLPEDPTEEVNATLVHEIMDRYDVPRRRLNCIFHMRSTDVGLGLPFNIASYALLTHMLAQCVNMEVGELVFLGGDVHIYDNHEKLRQVLDREPLPLCRLELNEKITHLDDFTLSDIRFVDYRHHPAIPLPVAV